MRRIFMNPVLTFVTYRRFLGTGVRGPLKYTPMSVCGAYNLSAVRSMTYSPQQYLPLNQATQITRNITRYIFSPIYNPLVNKQDYLDWTYMGVIWNAAMNTNKTDIFHDRLQNKMFFERVALNRGRERAKNDWEFLLRSSFGRGR